jgi:outer membrane protein assembly factor BamB
MPREGSLSIRVWPGVAAVTLLFACRFGLKAVLPGFEGFMYSVMATFVCAGLILLWWLFLSRAPSWLERIAGVLLLAAGLGATWLLKHESMGPAWMFAYAVPYAMLGLVGGAVLANRLASKHRLVFAGALLAATLPWTLTRTEGIDGDHRATKEQLVLAAPPPIPPVTPPPTAAADNPAAPAPAPAPAPAGKIATSALVPEPVATPVPVAEWPGFRGPNRDSAVRGVTIGTDWSKTAPVKVWSKPVGPGWSSFAVQGDVLYTQEQRGEEELVTAYRASTGEHVWRHADPIRFFESNAGAGPRATPTLANGRVYTLGATGVLNVLDAATGSRYWTRKTTDDTKRRVPDWGFSASPVVTQGLVIVYAGRLAAYDAATGALRWMGAAVGGSYSSPQLAKLGGVEQVLIVHPQGATGHDPASGEVLWSHEWKGLPIIQPSLLADSGGVNGLLISASQADGTRRIDPARGPTGGWDVATRWTSLSLKPYFNDTLIHKGHAYGFDARIMACIDLKDGSRKWKGGRYGNGQALLLAEQDLLLILTEDGEIALVKAVPEGFQELAKVPAIEGKTWNHPVIAAGHLFVRNGEQMAAFRLPAQRD